MNLQFNPILIVDFIDSVLSVFFSLYGYYLHTYNLPGI